MAKVKLSPMFESASGSLCSKNGTYIALNRQTGKMYQAEYHERPYPNTAKQQQVKATFTSKAQAAAQWWAQNKPLDGTRPDGTPDYQQVIKQYKAQRKYGNPYSYLRSLVQDDLTIRLGSTTVPSASPEGSGTTTPGTGGAPSLD